MTDRQKLAACPFCGKQPLGPLDTSYGYWRITCGDANECTVQPVADGDTKAEAIAAWNTRTPQGDELARELAEHIANLDKPGLDAFIAAQGPAASWFLRNRQRILAALTPTSTDAEQVKEAAAAIPDALWPFIQHNKDCVLLGHWMEAADYDCDCGLTKALEAMPMPTTDRERVLRELERDARDSRFSDELIGNRFRAALRAKGSHNHDD